MTRNSRVAVVQNRNAGKNAVRQGIAKAAISILKDALSRRTNLDVHTTGSLDELKDATDRIHEQDPGVIFSIGGDGSTHKLLSEVLPNCLKEGREPPSVVIVPLGTMNAVPTALGLMSADPLKTLQRIAEKIRHGVKPDTVHCNALKVNGKFGFIYGAGLPVSFLQRYYESDQRGVKRALQVIFESAWEELGAAATFRSPERTLIGYFPAQLRLDEGGPQRILAGSGYSGIVAATVDQVGMGCHVTYRAQEQLGRFHLVASSLGYAGHVRNLPSLFDEKGARLWGPVDDALVSSAVIRYFSPMARMIDGEIYKPEDLPEADDLSVGPHITFIRS